MQAILAGFGLCVFLNWATVGFVLPFIAKALFGAESVFTRSPASMLNTTFFAATLSLAYLCVDPIQKAVYVLRCFYGESLQSGEDLKAELRQASLGAQRLAACLVALVAVTAVCQGAGGINSEGRNPKAEGSPKSEVRSPKCLSANYANLREPLDRIRGNSRNSRISTSAFGFRPSFGLRTFAALSRRRSGSDFGLQTSFASAGPSSPPSSATISPPELDLAIQEVVQQRKYTWRMPREKIVEEETEHNGIIGRFVQRVGKLFEQWLETLGKWLEKFAGWLDGWLRRFFQNRRPVSPDDSGYRWILAQEILVFVLIAAAVTGLALLIYRVWRERQRRNAPMASEPIQPLPDLTDENLAADQVPEDGWTQLARELLERGELRLALRAFYLASLAHLAQRNLISLAKFKSNRDYERELGRRGHAFPELLAVFGENVSVFDRTW